MSKTRIPDQADRAQIAAAAMLRRNLLVEAAAGTGKTTKLIDRLVALIEEDVAQINHIAAVTFTRKAAAELRGRFQAELEKRARHLTGEPQARLQTAVANLEGCFIGTIHSFCARLLRERPVEARVDVAFKEMEESADAELRRAAWREHVTNLLAEENDPVLHELAALGIELEDLQDSFLLIADFLDVTDWPRSRAAPPDADVLKKELEPRIARIQRVVAANAGVTNPMLDTSRLVSRLAQGIDWKHLPAVMDLIEALKKKVANPKTRLLVGSGEDEKAWWENYREQAEKYFQQWLVARYEPSLRAILPALKIYERLRRERGSLSFQDLLLRAAALLREHPEVRRYFRRRFTHLLVDEFQDTDPIQAEVILLLTANDPEEKDWCRCRPVAGSLFVVGDPKQSIYRFRRADICTYEKVKSILKASGGAVIQIRASFRSDAGLLDWVNKSFQPRFAPAGVHSPEYVALEPTRGDSNRTGLWKQVWKKDRGEGTPAPEAEAMVVAGSIATQLQAGTRKAKDFLILMRTKKHLGTYAEALHQQGVRCDVTGGGTLNISPEVVLLNFVVAAATEPHNPLALVGALRSAAFGMSDRALFAFHEAGGKFDFRASLPQDMDTEIAAHFHDAWHRISKYARWLHVAPPLSALERIAHDLGLFARAAATENGSVRAGTLGKLLEILRTQQADCHTAGELAENLRRIVEATSKEDGIYDGIAAQAVSEPAVRLMTVHAAKGLEAPVVFLANPTGEMQHLVKIHIRRDEDATRGYIAVGKSDAYGKQKIMACPAEWENWSAEEQQFTDAEKTRLLYVAATRPREQLIVSLTEYRPQSNFWQALANNLDAVKHMERVTAPTAVAAASRALLPDAVEKAGKTIVNGRKAANRATYAIAAVKKLTTSAAHRSGAATEHGTEWGVVIHSLLEAAMTERNRDLESLAKSALNEQEMDESESAIVVETVKKVMRSGIWARALASGERLVEVPFQRLVSPAEDRTLTLPTLVRGVIDLVFREKKGWVLVDYKTDRYENAQKLEHLKNQYRGQVERYAAEWGRIVGQPPVERGLFFIARGDYVTL